MACIWWRPILPAPTTAMRSVRAEAAEGREGSVRFTVADGGDRLGIRADSARRRTALAGPGKASAEPCPEGRITRIHYGLRRFEAARCGPGTTRVAVVRQPVSRRTRPARETSALDRSCGVCDLLTRGANGSTPSPVFGTHFCLSLLSARTRSG